MGAKILVNKAEKLTRGEDKVLDVLRKMYKHTDYDVYIYVQQKLTSKKRPDFIILDAVKGIAVLEIKDWSDDYIVEVDKRNVNLVNNKVENPIRQVNGYKDMVYGAIYNKDINVIDKEDINPVIIFTGLDSACLQNEKLRGLFNNEVKYVFKDTLLKLSIENIFDVSNINLSAKDVNNIRAAIYPEIEVVSTQEEEGASLTVDTKSLDYDQEEFAKRIPYGQYIVSGIPGSGKTVILLARAVYLIKENPNWNILILTYNKSLKHKIASKLDVLAKKFKDDINTRDISLENIEVKHFHGLTSELSNRAKMPYNMDSTQWFQEEVVKLASQNAYEKYDAILIDEYQDFNINWIELCIKICKSSTLSQDKALKNIFLAGDRLQSIYINKDISWKSMGINMQGRSKFLKTSYRSAKQHMALALNFLKKDKTLNQEVKNFYKDEDVEATSDDLNAINNGNVEFVEGNYSAIGDKIEQYKSKGYKNSDFLVLVPKKQVAYQIIQVAPYKIKNQMTFIKDIDSNTIDNSIIITTYHSSKGLEAKVVFMVEPDNIYMVDDAEDQIKRKLIYVGMTRASENLIIHNTLNGNNKFYKELEAINKTIK